MASPRFEEAIDWAKRRKVVLPDQYYGRYQKLARAVGFSIAGVTKARQLAAVRDSLAEALESGQTFAQWKAAVSGGQIGLDLPDYRLETIFRTNIQGAFARGRCEEHRRSRETHPFLLYDAVNDSRTRPSHAALDGFIARYDDPRWNKIRPPNGFNCRCRLIALTENAAQRYLDEDVSRMQQQDYREARDDALVNGPDAGWDYDICTDPTRGQRVALDLLRSYGFVRDAVIGLLVRALDEWSEDSIDNP